MVFSADAELATRRHGVFRAFVTDPLTAPGEHLALVRGDVSLGHAVLCRVASACLTSTALGAADCDCVEQLDAALAMIDKANRGVLIYMAQEGRGHGLVTKIRALAKKNEGLDTLAAVEALGLPTDVREYSAVARILAALEVRSVILLTNNIAKLTGIRSTGVDVREVRALEVDAPEAAARHVAAKLDRFRIGRSDHLA